MESKDERLLIKQVAQGDRPAFQTVYELTYNRVHRYLKGFVRDELLVEDILIQTYTIVWQKAGTFHGTSRLRTWIIGIARHVAFNELRKNRTHAPFDERYLKADYASFRKPEHTNRSEVILSVLKNLSFKHREILDLVFYQDLTYQEIAEIIDIPVNTVKTRVFHAKKAFIKELEKQHIAANDF